jgi:succinate dehydrogenase/fumarate reductase cytochrome b subunit
MKNLHRASALILSVFVLAHIGNHVVGVFGLEAYFRYLTAVRQIYRHPIGEPILIGLIILQMFTGIAITVRAFQRRERRKLLSWIEIVAAWLFFMFITIHLASIAVTRFYFEMETDFLWVATMMRPSPLQPFVIAFHFLGIVVVTTHMGIGFRFLLTAAGLSRLGNVVAALVAVAGVVAAVIAIAGYTGYSVQ